MLFGIAPALRATKVDPLSAMKANTRGVTQGSKFGLSNSLVVIQMALSLVLVSGAGLLLATFIRLETLDPGFERQHVLLMDVDLGKKADSPPRRGVVFKQVLDHLRALPDVRSASNSTETPLGGAVSAAYLQIDGYTARSMERELVFVNEVSDRYFETLGTHLLSGRDFNAHDVADSPKVAIVNESFVHKYFHGADPVGRRYREEQGNKIGESVEIVGLVHDAKYLDLREEFHPTVYVASSQSSNRSRSITFEVLAAVDTKALMQEAKRVVGVVYPDASLQLKTLTGQVEQSLARERLLATLSAFFGGLGLLLAMVGIYGVTSYNMARRRKEIGIRIALGAQQWHVFFSVLMQMTILIGAGLAIGLIATIGATQLLKSLLYGVKTNDGRIFSLAAVILTLVGLTAGILPAYKASRLDPMDALREE